MASPIDASVVPSSLAEQYLQEGSNFVACDQPRQAKRAFNRAVGQDPSLARNIADYYDAVGDSLAGPESVKRKREYYGTAKEFYKRLLQAPIMPAACDPQLFRADLDCRIGNEYNKMSSLNGSAYNSHDTDRAIAYFNAAVGELGDLHMEQAHQGRLLALAKKLGHSQVRPWYQVGSRFEPAVLTAALQDLSMLYSLPADGLQLMERFATAETLFSYPMDAASEVLVKEEIIPQMASYLWQPPPNNTHAAVQKSVMSAFVKLLREHAWAAPEVANNLQTFVQNGKIQYEQLEPLMDCYRALIQGNKEYAGNAARDLELLRKQFSAQDRALGRILLVTHMFIDLHDSVNDETAPRQALDTTRLIGMNTQSQPVLLAAIDDLVYAADTYTGAPTDELRSFSAACIDALGDVAAAHDRPSSNNRVMAREVVKMHLLNMRRIPHLKDDVLRVLFEKLGVQAEEIAEPTPGPAPGPFGYAPEFAAARKLTAQN